jgi:histidinol dehydrogenase
MTTHRIDSPEAEAALRELEERRGRSLDAALRVADEAIAGVRARGDEYVAEQIARFDQRTIAPDQIRTRPRPVTIDPAMEKAIDTAIARVESFHLKQLPSGYRWTNDGTEIVHRVRPLRRAGVYVPGGRAVYISTLIMGTVPARIAGVKDVVVATTANAAERAELQYACNRLGITEIYRSGGAAAIAAMALGTQSLGRVDKIVGPGNAYVTAAKLRLIGEVGIDMTAGPTELVVIADETADAALVQADLDAQQEHGPDSAVICICIGSAPRPERATLTLLARTAEEAVAIVNRIAPEHLAIQAREAALIAEGVENAGAIYCGPSSAPAAGDYILGSNHVLPTAGSARFFSPLGVYDFVKRANVVSVDAADLIAIGPLAERLANFEGLPKHAASVAARLSGAPAPPPALQEVKR